MNWVHRHALRLERKFDLVNAIGVVFHIVDHALRTSLGGEARANKRTSSLARWKEVARIAGLRVRAVICTLRAPETLAPENSIMALERLRRT